MLKALKNLIYPKPTTQLQEIIFEDREETDPEIIEERLNTYYIESV